MLIINFSWHLKPPILFLPGFIQFQLPSISCSCVLSEIFFPFRSFHTVIPSILLSCLLVREISLPSHHLFCKPCSLPVPCVERGEQQCRTEGLVSLPSWNIKHRIQKLLQSGAGFISLCVALYHPADLDKFSSDFSPSLVFFLKH